MISRVGNCFRFEAVVVVDEQALSTAFCPKHYLHSVPKHFFQYIKEMFLDISSFIIWYQHNQFIQGVLYFLHMAILFFGPLLSHFVKSDLSLCLIASRGQSVRDLTPSGTSMPITAVNIVCQLVWVRAVDQWVSSNAMPCWWICVGCLWSCGGITTQKQCICWWCWVVVLLQVSTAPCI